MARDRLGGLHSARLLLYSFDFQEIESYQSSEDWDAATERMIYAARRLERAGANCIVICTNTMHKMANEVALAVKLPLLHIADAVGAAVAQAQLQAPLLLATRFTTEQDFYLGQLRDTYGIECVLPSPQDRQTVHQIIYQELCQGQIKAESRRCLQNIVGDGLVSGADSVLFGCTEIGLLLRADDVAAPVFDSAVLHAAAALDFALSGSDEVP